MHLRSLFCTRGVLQQRPVRRQTRAPQCRSFSIPTSVPLAFSERQPASKSDAESQSITTPTLLVLHGLFGSGQNFRSLAPHLVGSGRVHLLDMRGHGRSPHVPSSELVYDRMVDDIREHVRSNCDDGPVALLGHSMGGKIAMHFALRYPDLCNGLLVLDAAPYNYESFEEHASYARAMLACDLTKARSRADVSAMLEDAVPDESTRLFLLTNLAHVGDGKGPDGAAYAWRLDLVSILDRLESLRGWIEADEELVFDGRTLFLGGAAGRYIVPERDTSTIKRLFPEARLRMLADTGHWVHAQRPTEFCETSSAFFGERPLPSHALASDLF